MLKPTLLKILIAGILLIAFGWAWGFWVQMRISDTFPFGFPLQFFLAWGPCQPGENCSEFNGLYLGLDILFWYVVSAWMVTRLKNNERVT
ncbi:MAG: hypothetical protein RL536_683 [Candidatus Parcubacteria bacterium]|jgi:hypothetical protein